MLLSPKFFLLILVVFYAAADKRKSTNNKMPVVPNSTTQRSVPNVTQQSGDPNWHPEPEYYWHKYNESLWFKVQNWKYVKPNKPQPTTSVTPSDSNSKPHRGAPNWQTQFNPNFKPQIGIPIWQPQRFYPNFKPQLGGLKNWQPQLFDPNSKPKYGYPNWQPHFLFQHPNGIHVGPQPPLPYPKPQMNLVINYTDSANDPSQSPIIATLYPNPHPHPHQNPHPQPYRYLYPYLYPFYPAYPVYPIQQQTTTVGSSTTKHPLTTNTPVWKPSVVSPSKSTYTVSIEIYNIQKSYIIAYHHHCIGAIISPTFIVTTANCISKTPKGSEFRVVAGSVKLNAKENSKQVIKVAKKIIHSKHKGNFNDIALLQLEKPLKMNNLTSTVKLPEINFQPRGKAVIHKWSATTKTVQIPPEILKSAILPILPVRECLTVFLKYQPRFATNTYSNEENLCTESSSGDVKHNKLSIGSPLVQDNKLIGLMSWWGKFPCNCVIPPIVYTKVPHYIGFIKSHVKNLPK